MGIGGVAIDYSTVGGEGDSIGPPDGSRPTLSRIDRAAYWALLVGLVMCWTPSKALGYLAPYGMATVLVAFSGNRRALLQVMGWLVLWAAAIFAYSLIWPDFEITTSWLSAITYGSLLIPLALPNVDRLTPRGVERITRMLYKMMSLQAAVGLVQGGRIAILTRSFDMDNGDFVRGTMGFDMSRRGLENPMFAINMVAMIFFLIPSATSLRRKLALAAAIVAVLLASVMHLTYFAIVSVWLGLFFTVSRGKALRVFVSLSCAVALVALCVALLLPRNIATTGQNWTRFLEAKNAKVKLAVRIVKDIPREYPLAPLIGLGPAQFCSRAGLIGTGMYFGGPMNPAEVPMLPSVTSRAFSKYYLDLWMTSIREKYHGSTQHAYSSFLSVISEFGLPFFLGVVLGVSWILGRIRKEAKRNGAAYAKNFALTAALLCFLFVSGFQENYWEVPQAMAIPVFLLWLNLGRMAARHPRPGLRRATWRRPAIQPL